MIQLATINIVSGNACEQENIFEYRDALDDALIKQHIVAPERTSPYLRKGANTTLHSIMEGWMTTPLAEFSSPSIPDTGIVYSLTKDENPYFELARFTKTTDAPIDTILQKYVTNEISLDFLLHANNAKKGDILPGGASFYVVRTRTTPLEIRHTIQRFCSGFAEKDVCLNFCRSFRCGFIERKAKKILDYTFTESSNNCDTTIEGAIKFFTDKIGGGVEFKSMAYYSFILQTLFALEVLRMYKIQHNDISVETIKCHETDADVEYFEYTIDNIKVYVPNAGFIVKIGNFGSAVKYSHPTVGDVSEFEYDELHDLRTFAESLPEEYRNQIFIDEPNFVNQDIIVPYIGKPHGRGMFMGNIAPSSKHFSTIPVIPNENSDNSNSKKQESTSPKKKEEVDSKKDPPKKRSSPPKKGVSSSTSSTSSSSLSKKRGSPSSSSDEESNAKKACSRKSSLSRNYVHIQLDSLETFSGKDEEIIRMGLLFVDIFERSKNKTLFDNCKFDQRTWSRINTVFNNRLIFSGVLNLATETEGLIISDFALALSNHFCSQ
jgi:hypothetical protein